MVSFSIFHFSHGILLSFHIPPYHLSNPLQPLSIFLFLLHIKYIQITHASLFLLVHTGIYHLHISMSMSNKSTVDMIYLDFLKAFDKVDHGILLHKLRDLGITGRLSLWFFHFLNNRQHYVRMPGGISQPHPVLSGVPQGTVLGPLLFLIMIIDIDKGISPSFKLVSFADDTGVYSCINDIEKCDQLQIDLNSVYDWVHVNNMFFNA